jgi:hypothetical protein
MKNIFSFLLLVIIILLPYSCHPKLTPGSALLNFEKTDNYGTPMLLGACTRERLQQPPYGTWFNANYAAYKVDSPVAESLRSALTSKRFLIFMGTWCGDSRREVPRMFKLLDYCGVKASQIQLILVSNEQANYKQSPGHEEQGLDIHRVPDLLVYSDNKELGRIVESPVASLEKDLAVILNGKKYSPNYQMVTMLADLFHRKSMGYIEHNLVQITGQIKSISTTSAELNTYGYVLQAAHQTEKARLTFKLNTLLFPQHANNFISLAKFYKKMGNEALAKENLFKAIALEPEVIFPVYY